MRLSERKRTLLAQMGVDLWVQRSGAPVALPEARLERTPAVAPRPITGRASPSAPAREPVQTAKTPAVPAAAAEAAKAPPVPSFSVACFAKGDVLMLVEPGSSKAAVRFALDLLSAASGIWGGEVDRLDFDWPQPGIENSAATLSRAFGAFLAKQMSDRDPGLVLLGQEVAGRFDGAPAGCLMLPPLGALMTEGELKRQVWAALQERR